MNGGTQSFLATGPRALAQFAALLLVLCACSDTSAPAPPPTVRIDNDAKLAKERAAVAGNETTKAPRLNLQAPAPTNPEYLLSAAELAEFQRLLPALRASDRSKADALSVRRLEDLGEKIRRTIDEEWLDCKERGTSPYEHMHPARVSWSITCSAHAGLDIDGITGYFGNYGEEARLAPEAFELLGMSECAAVFREALAVWPAGKPLTAYPPPLDDKGHRALSDLERRFQSSGQDPFLERLRFAGAHPEIFFVTPTR